MSYPVESGVPLPESPHARGRQPIYPWRDLNVGESFFVPCKEGEGPRILIRRITPTAYKAGRKLGKTFTSRSMPDGVRVWRVA